MYSINANLVAQKGGVMIRGRVAILSCQIPLLLVERTLNTYLPGDKLAKVTSRLWFTFVQSYLSPLTDRHIVWPVER